LDYALTRGDVDPDRIAILGVSQGGYWVPRAVAFEPRIAAAVADPGVVDVSRAMTDHLPGAMRKLLDAGRVGDGDVDAWHWEWSATADGLVEVDREVGRSQRLHRWGTPVELVEIPFEEGATLPGVLVGRRQTSPAPRSSPPPRATQSLRARRSCSTSSPRSARRWLRSPRTRAPAVTCEGAARLLFRQRCYDWLDETLAANHSQPGLIRSRSSWRLS